MPQETFINDKALNDYSCRLCGLQELEEIAAFRSLPRVTSDCRPFRAGGRLFICHRCNAAQSPADTRWLEEITEIYSSYYAYHQSGGVEQRVLDPITGQLRGRSEAILNRLTELPGIPTAGKVLDVGCGGGTTLRVLSQRGTWRLYGMEMDARTLPLLEKIDGFEALYTCAPADLPSGFDLVTMIHALEHFPEPRETLRHLRKKITREGCLFIEVPNAEANPFDYVIADHMMHFTSSSLANLAVYTGFGVSSLSTTWVAKELSMAARAAGDPTPLDGAPSTQTIHRVSRQIDWLQRFIEMATESMFRACSFGLFGTSIAATWLCSILGERVEFFVEEDPSRIGRLHMGRPIVSPAQVNPKSTVFMALTPQVATRITERLSHLSIQITAPPAVDA